MHTITAATATSRVDSVFPGHHLTPAECIELGRLWDKNDAAGLMGAERERCEELMAAATAPHPAYTGPDERA